jgi:hypothetical protein
MGCFIYGLSNIFFPAQYWNFIQCFVIALKCIDFFLQVYPSGGSARVGICFRRKFLTSGLFILKSGKSADDTDALHGSVTEVANLEGPEENPATEGS